MNKITRVSETNSQPSNKALSIDTNVYWRHFNGISVDALSDHELI